MTLGRSFLSKFLTTFFMYTALFVLLKLIMFFSVTIPCLCHLDAFTHRFHSAFFKAYCKHPCLHVHFPPDYTEHSPSHTSKFIFSLIPLEFHINFSLNHIIILCFLCNSLCLKSQKYKHLFVLWPIIPYT